jgi:hypothetical protein
MLSVPSVVKKRLPARPLCAVYAFAESGKKISVYLFALGVLCGKKLPPAQIVETFYRKGA